MFAQTTRFSLCPPPNGFLSKQCRSEGVDKETKMKNTCRVWIPVFTLTVLLTSFSIAQEKMRTVEKGLTFPNQPIEIVGLELGNRPLIDDERHLGDKRILGDQDWLKKLTLSVKNISQKNILSFDIDLMIKKEGKILMGIPIMFRTYTKATTENAATLSGEKKLGVLRPGEVVKVKVSDDTMRSFGNALKKYDVENIDRVTIDIRGVYFDDHSRWMFGRASRPDPNNPGKRIPIEYPTSIVDQRNPVSRRDLINCAIMTAVSNLPPIRVVPN